MFLGFPIYSFYKDYREREAREAQRKYEETLPEAPDFGYTKQDVALLVSKNLLHKKIQYSLGDFITTNFTIHQIDCTDVCQIGIRKDTVEIELLANTYYTDGTLTFTRTDEYKYNFDTREWDFHIGDWVPRK